MIVEKLPWIGPASEPAGEDVEALISALEKAARGRGPAARRARAAVVAYRKQRSEAFMRVYIAREAEIEDALREAGAPVAATLHILRKVAATLGDKSQRMPDTQAAFARKLGLTPAQISRAFSALADAGALVLPLPAGKSQTWEVDATYCSCMPEPARLADVARQERDMQAAAAKAAAQAAKGRLTLKLVAEDVDGPVAGQPPLL